jgi:UDP-sulfoquinovose synthase
MRILVLGSDGYLGAATIQHLKEKVQEKQYDFLGVDNLLKRKIERELKIKTLVKRDYFKDRECDIYDYPQLELVIREYKPEAIIHYAEIPSAPFSMMNHDTCVKTQQNNIVGTLNLLWAIKNYVPDCHLIKLGTMGEYGTPNCDIPEGVFPDGSLWQENMPTMVKEGQVPVDKVCSNFDISGMQFPKQPGSWYHASKVCDSVNIEMACRIWGLRATDLNQGVVYGLAESFHYDEIFGTVLNRFIAQAVCGIPLTVYGQGNQKRAMLNIKDTMQCVELALDNPAENGEFRVFNQFTESFSVIELAKKIQALFGTDIRRMKNPRVEADEHYYNPTNSNLKKLGLKEHFLTDEVLKEMYDFVNKHKENIDITKIQPTVQWNKHLKSNNFRI